MVVNDSNLVPLSQPKMYCTICDFKCSKQSNWDRHIITRKHINGSKMIVNDSILVPKSASYNCVCGKMYKWESGYYRHKKKCSMNQTVETTNIIISDYESNKKNTTGFEIDKETLIKMLLKNQDVMENVILKNQEVMEKMMEIIPTIGNNSHNTINNTTNNQFNIQMFLKDHCKNAMNLTDFIDTLPITAETYDSTIDNGLTKTITNLITNGLSQLDILERPIHCTDASRKTLYVKEDNVWEKDNELVRMLLGIRQIAAKQRILINKWRDAHDDWNTNDRMQTRFTTLVCNSLDDIENNEKDNSKIIRSISKTVYLDNDVKNQYLE